MAFQADYQATIVLLLWCVSVHLLESGPLITSGDTDTVLEGGSWQKFQRQTFRSAGWSVTRSKPEKLCMNVEGAGCCFSLWSFFFLGGEREADHAEVAMLWSIEGEGVEEDDGEARKLPNLLEVVLESYFLICMQTLGSKNIKRRRL